MNKTILLLACLLSTQMASAMTLTQLAGSYKITHASLPIVNIVKISKLGNIKLTESSPYGVLECKGKGKIVADVLESQVKCSTGESFSQKINLKGIKSLDKFKATVFSSLYGQALEMNFEKL